MTIFIYFSIKSFTLQITLSNVMLSISVAELCISVSDVEMQVVKIVERVVSKCHHCDNDGNLKKAQITLQIISSHYSNLNAAIIIILLYYISPILCQSVDFVTSKAVMYHGSPFFLRAKFTFPP